MHERAILTAQEPAKSAPGVSVYVTILGNAYAISGKRDEAERVLAQLKELSKRQYVQPSYIAMVHAGLGDKDQAFEWLEKAYSNRDDRLVFVMTDPLMDSLGSDPRFQDLSRRIGLPERH
jgi:Flp pilus assembly protein TadD